VFQMHTSNRTTAMFDVSPADRVSYASRGSSLRVETQQTSESKHPEGQRESTYMQGRGNADGEEPFLVEWDSNTDPENPLNFLARKKVGLMFIIAVLAFLTYFPRFSGFSGYG